MNNLLEIKNLKVNVDGKQIINGIDLSLEEKKVHALMGPNGSGKSTLAQVLMGNPAYQVTEGQILYKSKNLLGLEPYERAQEGIFLSFQYPSEITGVSISSYLRTIYSKRFGTEISPIKFKQIILEKMKLLEMDDGFLNRYLNEGFSGGEKKRMEILQLLVLQPEFAILDETDSGLDIDAIRIVSKAINYIRKNSQMTCLIITHYNRILNYIEPDRVYIMKEGKIVQMGTKSIVSELEKNGYSIYK